MGEDLLKEEIFTRAELHSIATRATAASEGCLNPYWKRVYLNLAQAADIIDAYMGRSTVYECAEHPLVGKCKCEEE